MSIYIQLVIHFCNYDFCRRNTTDNFDTSELENDFLTRNNSERIAMTHNMIESTRKVCSLYIHFISEKSI